VIIYKFTQGNIGAKKIAKSRFQSPVKKKKIATLASNSAIPVLRQETSEKMFNSYEIFYDMKRKR
jgi:hypothetical protein